VFEARDLRVYGRSAEGYSLKQVSERFRITADGEPCVLEGAQVTTLGSRLRFSASWMCKDHAEDYLIEMAGLNLLDPSHKHRAKVDDGEKVTSHTLTPGGSTISFSEKPPPEPKNIFERISRLAKTMPDKAPEQSEIPLSWWGFIAWGLSLCIVLAALIQYGRRKRISAPQSRPTEEEIVAMEETPID